MADQLNEQSHENELNRLWNDLLDGRQDQHGYVLPDEDAQALIKLHMRGTSILPGSARERAWQETLTRIDIYHHQEETTMESLATVPSLLALPSPNGRALPTPVARLPVLENEARWRRGLLAGAIAAAALVMLAAAFAGYLLFGPGESGNDPQPVIPAVIEADGTPTPDAPEAELLLQTVLPDGVMATGEQVGAGFVHYSFPVTSYPSTWYPYCCSGPMIEFVVDGVYTIQAQEPIQVIRSDGSVEDIPADTEVVLNAGDGLISNVATIVDISNSGPETVELLNWAIIGDGEGNEDFNGRQPMGWQEVSFDGFGFSNPPSPALVSLWKITLDPAEVWNPPADSTVFRVLMPSNDEGTPTAIWSTTRSVDGVITNMRRDSVDVYVLTLEPAFPDSATPTP